MENYFKLNFLPTYGHRTYYISLGLIFCSLMVLLSRNVLSLNQFSIEIIKWVIGCSFYVLTFSREKIEKAGFTLLKYYSGKITTMFIVGTLLGLRLTELLTKRDLGVQATNFVILGLVFYHITYQFLKFKAMNKEIELVDTRFPDNIKNNPTLSWIVLFLSVFTFILIFIL